MKKCPFCAEEIQYDAVKCKYCGEWLQDVKKQDLHKEVSFQSDTSHVVPISQELTTDRQKGISLEFDKEKIERPWVRYWARWIDMLYYSIPYTIIVAIVSPSLLYMKIELPFLLLGLFTWVFFEALLLSTWGTTPGKALLKTTVQKSNSSKITLTDAFKRSFRVWLRGLGTGFPLVSIFTLVLSYRTLNEFGQTTWDRDGGFVVTHKKIGTVRVLIAVLSIVVFVLLVTISKIK